MAQKYRIYINDNVLLLTDRSTNIAEKSQSIEKEGFDFQTFCKKLQKGKKSTYVIVDDEPKLLFKTLKRQCISIKAAGGLVENSKGEYLFIYRNKRWDLPKGKVEKGEEVKIAAVREVEEECGVVVEQRSKRLCKTYHIYELHGKIVLKTTSWYPMIVKGKPKLIPQKAEGITSANWVDKSSIKAKTKNTYPLILEVLKAKRKLLKETLVPQ